MNNISKASKIYVAGHRGMVGSAIVRALKSRGFNNLVLKTHRQLDLTCQADVQQFFIKEQPHYVFMAAAKVGGIHANATRPADFIYTNLMIQANILEAAQQTRVRQLLFLGSSCIYPKMAGQPMTEDALMTGSLEPTNEPYAIAKIAGIKMCESYNRQHGADFRSVMPTNLYGANDNFHPLNSHVIPGLIRKFHDAKANGEKQMTVWGTGQAKREFLHVDDMARACLMVMGLSRKEYKAMTSPTCSHINIGSGEDIRIRALAQMVKEVVGFNGRILFNADKPDGPPRKWLNTRIIKSMGFVPDVDLKQGLEKTYAWFLKHHHIRRNAA